MKQMIFSFMALFLFLADTTAQYNRVFYNGTYSGGTQTGERGYDLVDAGNGHTCLLSTNWGVLSLKELDFAGNVVCSETFTGIGAVLIERLCKAPNGDYLVAGRQTLSTVAQPIIGRFRKNPSNPSKFICVWFYKYPNDNVNTFAFGRGDISRINIVRAEDDVNESYIIATEGDDFGTPIAGSGAKTVHAFKIDANGNEVWNKKYYDNSGTAQTMFVKALAYGHVMTDGQKFHKYLIGGCADFNDKVFYMFIDGNGNLLSPFIEYDMPGIERFTEAIYDFSTSEFILSNEINAGIGNAQIAVSKIDYYTHTITQTDLFEENDPNGILFTGARTITQDATGMHYLISGVASNEDINTGVVHSGPFILKIDKSANVQFFKRYNRLAHGGSEQVLSIVGPGGIENYALGVTTTTSDNSRVLTTDISGITCGEEDVMYVQNTLHLSPTSYTFSDANISGRVSLVPTAGGSFMVRDCDPANPEYKRGTTGVNNIEKEGINVYPTVLTQQESVINLEVPTSKAANLSIVVYSQDGREIKRELHSLNSGKNSIKFDSEITVPGIYIFRIDSDNPGLKSNLKIIKL